MGMHASEQARRFSWDRFSVQVADIVAQAAAERPLASSNFAAQPADGK